MFLFIELPSGCRRTAPELRDRLRREGYAQRSATGQVVNGVQVPWRQPRPLADVGWTPPLDCSLRSPKCQIASARLPMYQKLAASTAKKAALCIESQKYSKKRV